MADLDLDKLKEFLQVAREAGVTELKVETGKEKYCVQFGPVGIVAHAAPQPQPMNMATAVAAKSEQPAPGPSKPKSDNLIEVTSPFVGTFYRSASPGAALYVNNGDKVKKGQVLCIVEAMKIMNEIESEVSGEIVEICVENETYVEYGQVLFRVKP